MNNLLAAGFTIDRSIFPPARFATFGQLASNIITVLISVAAAVSIIFIMIAGIKLVTSSGDEKKLASATSTLTYAIIGLSVTILAFMIVRILQHFLKSNVPIT